MNYVYLSLGTNLFVRERNLKYAIKKISEFSKILEISSIYESYPYGYEKQNTFLNMTLLIVTNLSPFLLLENIQKVENLMNRKRLFKNSPRVIDIDILLFNELTIKSNNLEIPHYDLYSRKFFVIPLLEIISRGYSSLNFNINKCNFKDKDLFLFARKCF
ncbi:MAG: 2-amino-4-hydroxy-6-hydroxymethyldihydropteridine diphosphokinase [candidate division WOR-3 bacterium]|nr:2-amino-4-hydroxy-6-hydroxymethyldihydropteridine diphosphokinase [candidate division WOR-3 bacterium]MCX7947098.1 2-amino-4-hydroxy-6-hydroxymethyldihydropteridine diphosphokinase [candidate division WOR-3 bacterium]MDW8149861.1 2-amino-4-hydroxy-6-hydroxymethyldihydropteridine diphosphokinase [candidate division WOR-3 bacterium]